MTTGNRPRRTANRASAFALSCLLAACTSATSPGGDLTTGLTGVVVKGPVTPVCIEGIPCEAPFAAGFSVHREGARVGGFHSDAEGRFLAFLPPGRYSIVPDDDAPLPSPRLQRVDVEVVPDTLTRVRLAFDTYIR